jgi:hypothetical protein
MAGSNSSEDVAIGKTKTTTSTQSNILCIFLIISQLNNLAQK